MRPPTKAVASARPATSNPAAIRLAATTTPRISLSQADAK
jgi:hypothetical protein